MAITPGVPLTYDDLVSTALVKIKSLCHNINAYSASVPDQVKGAVGYTQTDSLNMAKYTYTLEANTDGVIGIVPESTVDTQFNNFISYSGIGSKGNKPITTRGIMNFYNNLSSFCAVRLVSVSSQLAPNPVMFYNAVPADNISTYPNIAQNTDSLDYVGSTDVTTLLNSLNESLNKVTKTHTVQYATSISCSSSSSSSSSCSCSSSSSIYIAYFNLR